MTKKEFYEAVVETEGVAEEVLKFAEAEIAKMEANQEALREKSETQKAKTLAEARETLAGYFGEVKITAPEVAADLGISTQKASAMLRKLEAAGDFVADKTGKKVIYSRAVAAEEIESVE